MLVGAVCNFCNSNFLSLSLYVAHLDNCETSYDEPDSISELDSDDDSSADSSSSDDGFERTGSHSSGDATADVTHAASMREYVTSALLRRPTMWIACCMNQNERPAYLNSTLSESGHHFLQQKLR